jgi:hypothetical protein
MGRTMMSKDKNDLDTIIEGMRTNWIGFVAKETNTGPVTINDVRVIELKRKGKPLVAGDIVQGVAYEFDRETGEIVEEEHKHERS